jgi:hypothetical protein
MDKWSVCKVVSPRLEVGSWTPLPTVCFFQRSHVSYKPTWLAQYLAKLVLKNGWTLVYGRYIYTEYT